VKQVEAQLKKLASRGRGILSGVDARDLAAVYRAAGLPASNVMTTRDAAMTFYSRIETALQWPDPKTAVPLDDVERHLVIRWLADDAPLKDLVILIDTLKEATRIGEYAWQAPPFSEEARWVEALGSARDYHRVYQRTEAYSPFINARHQSVADAIKRLRREGVRVEVRDGGAHIAEAERLKVGRLLNDGVRDLGGFEFGDFLFRRMADWFDDEQKRHHAVRHVTTTGSADGIPVAPVAYLLQLAAKHATVSPDPKKVSAEYATRLLDVATAFADALDIRSVSAFEGMFKDNRTLLPYLREIVLFDGTYSLVQARPLDAARILRRLFDWVPGGHVLPRSGCSVAQFTAVVEAIATIGRFRGPGLVSRAQVATALPSSSHDFDLGRVLDACSHDPSSVNAGYVFPWDQPEATHGMKPLIKDSYDYVLMDPSWCSPAFYEVLAAELREASLDVEHQVGPALERLVRAELLDRGVTSIAGKYDVRGIQGECDLVVETSEKIIFFEIKKKVLRRAAKGGDPVALLVDLSEALFSAQVQAARHELLLYRDGELTLDDGGRQHRIVRAARSVERVALTHLDYGSLQDRQVLSNLFRVVAGASIRANDPTAQAALVKLERRGAELARLHNELHALRPMNGDPFFNCWFLSLGHLLVMLDHVSSHESLWDALGQTRHMTTGSLDFYFEYAQARAIRSAPPAPSAA
jgi:hypothetical protein